ncbi:transglycosylase SLT domain-containing protein [Streptacidiphilus cavernicola]|uniref:Transglycosylase SLT domain-containing protein n=1 Tax=Streptacidiphilus cavernicola TaxID=3342716 RepID=A0ABV6W3C9_9ACTN
MPAAQKRRLWGWAVVVAAAVVIGWTVQHHGRADGSTGAAGASGSARPSGSAGAAGSGTAGSSTAGSAAPSPSASLDQNDTALFAPQVVTYAKKAGIDPQLLMAILYNESYKPHDPAFQRSWQKLKPDAAFGIANMHKAAFDDTKQGRDFADRSWDELPDDPGLAIEAAAYYLHDLGRQLPAHLSTGLSRDELMALGYNTGAGNMQAFARGVKPGAQAQTYLDTLHQNWAKAGADVKAAESG